MILNFLDKLCHECNKALPSINWASKLYGRSDFECSFGWYISKMRYELGINYNNWYVMREILSKQNFKKIQKEYAVIEQIL